MSLFGCSKPHESYVSLYKKSLANKNDLKSFSTSPSDEKWVLNKVENVMKHLKSDDLDKRVRESYADKLYLNDTLHTFTTVDEVAKYLVKTGNKVSMIEIDFDDVALKGTDAYVRWTMRFQTGKKKSVLESVGMTHFRFNQEGKIILHQDYWDGVEGFYRALPVVGYLLQKVKDATGD